MMEIGKEKELNLYQSEGKEIRGSFKKLVVEEDLYHKSRK
jgi:hypothetical protein